MTLFRLITAGFLAVLALVFFHLAEPQSSVPAIAAVAQTSDWYRDRSSYALEAHQTVNGVPGYIDDPDHYYFENSTPILNPDVEVKVNYYDTFQELAVAYGHPELSGKLMGFTVPPHDNVKFCSINLINPKVLYYPQYVGHEFLHCVHGNFHPSQG
jgi:hypothetical protein